MEWIWTAIVIISLVAEFITVGDLVAIWFALSGIITLLIEWIFTIDSTIQIIIFILLSGIFILALRPVCLKALKNSANEKTNLDAIKESKVKLLEDINPDKMGTAKLNGIIYNCIAKNDNETISENTICKVVEISGNKLVVEKIENI